MAEQFFHVVSMTIDHKTRERVGTCQCGREFRRPSRHYKKLDADIEAHWNSLGIWPAARPRRKR